MTHAAVCCDPAAAPAATQIKVQRPCAPSMRDQGRVHVPPVAVFPKFGFDGMTLFTPTPHWSGMIIG